MTRPLAVIVLAAGQGTRMKSVRHKVLHPVAGRPMLLHLLAAAAELAPARTVIVVGAGREQVEAAVTGTGAQVVVQHPQLGTGHAVAQAESTLAGFDGDILVLYGDVPLVSVATMAAMRAALDDRFAAVVLGFRPIDPASYGRILAIGDRIERMVEYRDATASERAVTLCNSGLLAVRARDLWPLLARVGNANAASEYYLPDIVGLADRPSRVIEADAAELMGVNDRADLARVESAWQARRRAEVMAAGVSLVAPDTVHLSYDTELAADVTVETHVVFGVGVRVAGGATIRAFSHLEGATVAAGAEIGPYARLRPGADIGEGARVGNFVEVKKSRLGAGAKANHLAYLGDAEIGARANIGAGTITCNYDGFRKHRTIIGEEAFIGSNSALVAPVAVGAGAIVAAGTTLTANVASDALAMNRAPQTAQPGWAARFRAALASKKAS